MAAILPISDRRARLSLILALLGFPSLGVTLPAAAWLGVGAVRQQRLSGWGEPAMGFLALVVTGLDLLFVQQVFAQLSAEAGPATAWAAAAWAAVLAMAVGIAAVSLLRIHPERRGVALTVRSAVAASAAGGTALFARLVAVIQS
jgi:hypothetical protein